MPNNHRITHSSSLHHKRMARLGPLALLAAAVAALGGCGGDPLLVVGRVDVSVDANTTLVVDFPVATTLVRSPRAINTSVAGDCTVTRDAFDVVIARDESSAGLHTLHVTSTTASVEIDGDTYEAATADGACFIEASAMDASYGTVTFDVDCTLRDGAGGSVSAVGTLTLEGCH